MLLFAASTNLSYRIFTYEMRNSYTFLSEFFLQN